MPKQLNDDTISKLKAGKFNKLYGFPGARAQGSVAPPGFGVRVTPGGCRSFFLRYTVAGAGKERLQVIGQHPCTSVTDAIKQARKLRQAVDRGEDPMAMREQAEQVEENTFKAIADNYFATDGAEQRSRDWQKQQLSRLVYPELGGRDIAAIKRSDVVRVMDAIVRDNGKVMADRTLAVMSKIMSWHALRSDDYRSPIVRGMARTNRKERARKRILTADELRAVWQAAEAWQGPFGRMVQFIVLTAARRSEACEMTWDEIIDGVWTLPAERNKTKEELDRPLLAALAVLPPKVGTFVFSCDGGVTPIGKGSVYEMVEKLQRISGTADWTLHDLRRTARSLLSDTEVPADHAERCLGHVIGGVRGVYDRHKYLRQMKTAYEALAVMVDRIVHPADNVVALRA